MEDLAKIPPSHFNSVRMIVIGCAPYKFIEGFRKETQYLGELYCDPEREIYQTLGLPNTMGTVTSKSSHVKSSTLGGILNSTWRGLKSMALQGNVLQQGGAFVLGPGGEIFFAHQDQHPHDHADINALLAAAELPAFDFGSKPTPSH